MNKQLSEVLAQMVIYANREINIVYESRGQIKWVEKKHLIKILLKFF